MPTERGFTGQPHDATGLVYMNARYYDPLVGQFASPDTVVPDPTMVMDYNRYLYARANPLKYNDPTGHNGVAVHDGGGARPRLHERERIEISTSLQAAGITIADVDTWTIQDLRLVSRGVNDLANMVGGSDRLETLTGGSVNFTRDPVRANVVCPDAGACAVPGPLKQVTFNDGAFYDPNGNRASETFSSGTAVHELAHMMDFNSDNWLACAGLDDCRASDAFPGNGIDPIITDYSLESLQEYFAEGVTDWVYGNRYKPPTRDTIDLRHNVSDAQRTWLENTLR